jgi:hypothetical protein
MNASLEGLASSEVTGIVQEINTPEGLTPVLLSKILDCARSIFNKPSRYTQSSFYTRHLTSPGSRIRYVVDRDGIVIGFVASAFRRFKKLKDGTIAPRKLFISVVGVRSENRKRGVYSEIANPTVREAILKHVPTIRTVTHSPRIELGIRKILDRLIEQKVITGYAVKRFRYALHTDLKTYYFRDIRGMTAPSGDKEIDAAYLGRDGTKQRAYTLTYTIEYPKL